MGNPVKAVIVARQNQLSHGLQYLPGCGDAARQRIGQRDAEAVGGQGLGFGIGQSSPRALLVEHISIKLGFVFQVPDKAAIGYMPVRPVEPCAGFGDVDPQIARRI